MPMKKMRSVHINIYRKSIKKNQINSMNVAIITTINTKMLVSRKVNYASPE